MTVRDLREQLAGLPDDVVVCVPGPSGWFTPAGHIAVRHEDSFAAGLTGNGPVALVWPSGIAPPTGWASSSS